MRWIMAYKDVILKYLSHVSPYEIAKFVGVDTEMVESISEEIKNIVLYGYLISMQILS
jgi:hypothetical protein